LALGLAIIALILDKDQRYFIYDAANCD
jgi:hypothetical protein